MNIRESENTQYGYNRTQMQRDRVISLLKERGLRITKQRLILLDIILEEGCSCCKEIHYKASKQNVRLGKATVYRMINTLEEIGAISRRNMYKIECCSKENCNMAVNCRVELEDNTVYNLTEEKLNHVISAGLNACGYMTAKPIKTVTLV